MALPVRRDGSTQATRSGSGAAFTLVELCIAFMIFVTGLVSIGMALWGIRDQYIRADLDLVGRLVAESILEQVHERWSVEDGRYFDLSSSPQEIATGALGGAWRRPFETLCVTRTPLITPAGVPNPYFEPSGGPLLPSTRDRSAADFPWEDLSYEVRVSFEIERVSGTPATPLDADGDGEPERDVGLIEVLVFLEKEGEEPRAICQLSSILAMGEKMAGADTILGGPPASP